VARRARHRPRDRAAARSDRPAQRAAADSAAPRPYADPRFIETLLEPGGGVRLRSEFYIERDADRRLQRELSKVEGTTITILMVISTEPHLLISDVSQSPFNVGTKIALDDLTLPQVAELNRRYHAPLDDSQLPALADLLGGHPYLTSRALYTLVTEDLGWNQLVQIAASQKSPFSDHLRRYLWLLRDKPQLTDALRQIISRGRCPDQVAFYRLMQAGLVQGADSQSCACRCKLYEMYLKDKL
jgi:hypothetical protein